MISLLIHGFSPVNARLLIAFGTAFYAITLNIDQSSTLQYSRFSYNESTLKEGWSFNLISTTADTGTRFVRHMRPGKDSDRSAHPCSLTIYSYTAYIAWIVYALQVLGPVS